MAKQHISRLKPAFVLLAYIVLSACGPAGLPREAVGSTHLTIYHNGVVLTMNPDAPAVEAIAIRGEHIEAVGKSEEILVLQDDQSAVIDLRGRALMPGFVDAHSHIFNDRRRMDLSLDEAQVLALQNGITTLADLFVDQSSLRELLDFASENYLRVRTSLYLTATNNCGRAQGDWYQEYPPTRAPGEMLRIGGVKIFADGGTCGEPAFSFEIEPGSGEGDLWHTQQELNELIMEAQSAGYQVAIHAVGDRAVVQTLNAIEQALEGGPNTYRHRMEHASVTPPEHLNRFGELGVSPVYFGQSFSCTEPFGVGVPPPYWDWDQPYSSMREINPGLSLAWSSDVPFGSKSPLVHLLGFVTRMDHYAGENCAPREWHRDDGLPVEEALSIMTIQSAYALHREEEVGSLEPGKLADLIVLSADPTAVDVVQLAEIEVLLTVVGGIVEHCQSSNTDLCPDFTARAPVK
jgi:predicted amidohydrolase YtcJ